MRKAERGERERAAFALATAYASTSPTSRTATSSGGWATCRRPMSARSTASNRYVATGGRASSARSRRGWVGEIDEQLSLGLDFRRRRAVLRSRPRGPAGETRGIAVNDLEALEDQNQRLKVALSRLVEENKRYRVNKTRLEGELLRADAKVEILLCELEQAPGKRDQRLLNAARREVEKCAVVRTLAKQKEHLQKTLACQERELDEIKQTKEWSAVVEMTAATEEYFLEIRRLQRLLAQQQQGTSAKSPVTRVSDREGGAARESYVPNQCDPTYRRNSGVDDTVWIHRPENCYRSMSVPSPVDGVQDNQRLLDAEMAFTSSGGEVYNTVHEPTRASAVQANEFHVAHREDNDMLLHDWGVPAFRGRGASPKRRVSPRRRAQMAMRSGRETFDHGIHKKVSAEPRSSRRTTQVARGVLGRKQKGGSRSQVWIRAAETRTSAHGADAQRAVGVKSRPLSAPRTKREMKMTTVGDARRAASLSPFDKGRRQVASSDRYAAAERGGDGSAACVRQQPTPRLSASSSRAHDHRICTVPDPKDPRSWETGDGGKRRPKSLSRSASPRSSSAGNITSAGAAFCAQGEGTTRTASASVTKRHVVGRKGDEGGEDYGDEGVGEAGTMRSSQRVVDDLESPPLRDDDRRSDDAYFGDAKRRRSSSVPSRESLAAAAPAEYSPTTVAKECAEDSTATTKGQEVRNQQTEDCGSTLDTPGNEDVENATKDKESRVPEGDGFYRTLAGSGPSSWGSFEAVGEPQKNEAKEGDTEERSVRPVSSAVSTDDDARENPNVDMTTGEKSTTSTSNIKSDDRGGGHQVTVDEKTDGLSSSGASPRSGSNGSPNDGDNNTSSPLPELGDDNTLTRSSSSRAVTEKDHPDKLLFDIEGDGESVGDDPLCGENGATPSEYGDDFDDDFEDEED